MKNIIGQDHIVRYVTQGLKGKNLSPSLLFIGMDGVGKKTVALALAKSLCGESEKVETGQHPDVLVINKEFQAGLVKGKAESQNTIKIESVRHLTKFLSYKAHESERRVVIIEDAHQLTTEAANALLKILEEPPEEAQLILLATDEKNLPSTIRSRCALLHFHPLASVDIAKWLMAQEEMEFDKAERVASQAGGSLSKALKIADEEEDLDLDLSDYSLDEFFDLLSQPSFRREGRKKAQQVVSVLIEKTQKKLESGDAQANQDLQILLSARKQMDRYVPPQLVLENLYLKLR